MTIRTDGVYQVWRHNLEDTFDQIRDIVEDYPFISITTLIPGIVARPITHVEYSYQTVKCNVDLLNVIQLGFTFANSKGEMPKFDNDDQNSLPATVQFNFHFNSTKDIQFQEFTDYLAGEGNLDLHCAEYEGIDLHYFGELMFSSGLVMNEDIKWVSLHGAYDFGFLLKTLTCTHLPRNTQSFKELLHDHFPCLYDLKSLAYVAGLVPNGYISFKEICSTLHMTSPEDTPPASTNTNTPSMRIAAGIDSRNCNIAFFKLIKEYFQNSVTDKAAKCGLIYGIDDSIHLSRSMTTSALSPNAEHFESQQQNNNNNQASGGDSSSQHQAPLKGSNTHDPKPDRLPPGMLRVKPSQISSFSRVTASAVQQNGSSNNNPTPFTSDSPGAMDSKSG